MHDIEQLEKKWRIYRFKRMAPAITAAVVVAGGAAAWLFVSDAVRLPGLPSFSAEKEAHRPVVQQIGSSAPKQVAPSVNASVEPAKSEAAPARETVAGPLTPSSPVSVAAKTPKTGQAEKKVAEKPRHEPSAPVVLNADTGFLTELAQTVRREEARQRVVDRPVRERLVTAAPVKKTIPAKPRPTEPVKPEPTEKKAAQKTVTKETSASLASIEPEKKKGSSGLLIQTKQTNNTLEYLIKRFNQTQDPKLASYIAQSFYKKGNYEETVRWSIVANSLDPSGEESWLLFAKAKVALGQREDAINALRIYLNQYSSRKVKSYLDTLETGR